MMKHGGKSIPAIVCVTMMSAVPVSTAAAEGLVIGIAGKSASDGNFITVLEGCQKAAKANGDRCVFVGKEGPAHFRYQNAEINKAIAEKIDGLGVSVIESARLVEDSIAKAEKQGIPVVSFDSDFDPEHKKFRAAYIGNDNFALGESMGAAVREAHPKGGVLCIMRGHPDTPNLNQRVEGVRKALANGASVDTKVKLTGQGGWTEHPRCPLNDSREKNDVALDMMEKIIRTGEIDAFVAVGWWPQMAENYPQVYEKLRASYIEPKKIVVAVAGTSDRQLDLLSKGLGDVNVGPKFFEQGEKVYEAIIALKAGKTLTDPIATGMKVCTRENVSANCGDAQMN